MGHQLFVVVSDARIARDLFVSNGAIFSSCKQYIIKNKTILRGCTITATPYNDTWSVINEFDAMRSWRSLGRWQHRRIAHILVRSLYHKLKMGTLPIDPAHFAGRYALKWVARSSFPWMYTSLTAILNICDTYRFYVRPTNGLCFGTRHRVHGSNWWLLFWFHPPTPTLLTQLVPGPWSNIVNFVEPLQWIPTSTRSHGRRLQDGIMEVYGAMIMRVKARMDVGEDVPDCLVKTLLLTQEKEKLDWEDLYTSMLLVFTLGGVHPFKLTTQLINSSLIDFRHHSVVPRPHFVIPWCPGQGAHQAWYSNQPRLLAISQRWTAPPVYTRHHQRSTCCTWTQRADCVSHFLRWSVCTRRFGWLHPIILPRTLCTMRCTFQRTQSLFPTVTTFTIMRRNIQICMTYFTFVCTRAKISYP